MPRDACPLHPIGTRAKDRAHDIPVLGLKTKASNSFGEAVEYAGLKPIRGCPDRHHT